MLNAVREVLEFIAGRQSALCLRRLSSDLGGNTYACIRVLTESRGYFAKHQPQAPDDVLSWLPFTHGNTCREHAARARSYGGSVVLCPVLVRIRSWRQR